MNEGQTCLRRFALGEENFLTVLTKAMTKVRPAYVRGIARIQGKEVGPTLGPGMAWVTEPVNSTRSKAFSWIHGSSSSTSTSTSFSFDEAGLLLLLEFQMLFEFDAAAAAAAKQVEVEENNNSGCCLGVTTAGNDKCVQFVEWKGITESFLGGGRNWEAREQEEEEVEAIIVSAASSPRLKAQSSFCLRLLGCFRCFAQLGCPLVLINYLFGDFITLILLLYSGFYTFKL